MKAKNKKVLTGHDAANILSGGNKGAAGETFGLFGQYQMLPIIFTLAIIPLIVFAVLYDSGLPVSDWFEGGQKFDVFLIAKGHLLYFAGVIMAIAMAFKLADDDARGILKKGMKWVIPTGVFALLALISTIVSPFRATGLSAIGGYEQHESIWVMLCYCIVLVYTYLAVTDEHCVQIIRVALGFLAFVESLLGISQITGHDFFSTTLGRTLMVPNSLAQYRDSLTFTFSGTGNHQVYLTLYNPNYVGVYASLMLPICAILLLSSKAVWKKIWWALMFIGTMICALGCGSKSFMISFVIVFVIAVIFYRKKLLKGWPVLLGALILTIVAAGLYFNHEKINPLTYISNAFFTKSSESQYIYADFEKDGVNFEYNSKKFSVSVDGNVSESAINIVDESGKNIETVENETGYTYEIKDDILNGFTIARYNAEAKDGNMIYYLSLTDPKGYHVDFTKTDDGYKYVTSLGAVVDVKNAPSAVFTDNLHFASGRGYIWSRTIPLLKKYILLGAGADGFTQAFPQDDYIGKLNSGYLGLIITKPHNMYLQTGVNAGVLALICQLAVFVIYLVGSLKTYWKAELSDEMVEFGLALNLGIVGYLIAALMNDSCVALAPVFWVLLGTGFAVNRLVRERESA